MPFYARSEFQRVREPGSIDAGTAADLVSRFVTEAFVEQGFSVVAPNDLALAFMGGGEVAPRLDALLPSSVGFSVTLYAAPSGEKLWTARFDETQESLMANPLKARRYPGGGTRWLSAAEFTRWGAGEMARALLARP